jgi:hypothetical protein
MMLSWVSPIMSPSSTWWFAMHRFPKKNYLTNHPVHFKDMKNLLRWKLLKKHQFSLFSGSEDLSKIMDRLSFISLLKSGAMLRFLFPLVKVFYHSLFIFDQDIYNIKSSNYCTVKYISAEWKGSEMKFSYLRDMCFAVMKTQTLKAISFSVAFKKLHSNTWNVYWFIVHDLVIVFAVIIQKINIYAFFSKNLVHNTTV